MNEQIQNILNENGTKTSKIQKLLTLGLTRRQVSDLVAGGNYGFVQNVYKRMMQGMTQGAAQAAGIRVEVEGYNHTDHTDHWKLVTNVAFDSGSFIWTTKRSTR